MSRYPEYRREGWRTAGPGLCRCPHCGTAVTTNALGRASHIRSCKGLEQMRAARAKLSPPNEVSK
jgi:hypothetical protein